jgi:glycosyltransferase involved in cell wall biosynthesis
VTKKQMKRALFVVPADVANGAERVTAHYAAALARRGDWEVTFRSVCSQRTPSFGATLQALGLRTQYGPYPRERVALPSFLFGLPRVKYDLVFSSILHINGLLALARCFGWLRAGCLITRESNVFSDRYTGLTGIFRRQFLNMYKSQDRIIVQTQEMGAKLLPLLSPKMRNCVTVVPNPIDAGAVRALADREIEPDLASKLSKRPHIIWIGRFIDWKRPNLAIDIIKDLRDIHNIDIGLVMLGSGPLIEAAKFHARALGVGDDVLILGRRENPYAVAKLCRIGLSTSLGLEGFPNVILEMMASGVPSIVSTPGADGLNSLPGVRVTRGFEKAELLDEIATILSSSETSVALYDDALDARHPDVVLAAALSGIKGVA